MAQGNLKGQFRVRMEAERNGMTVDVERAGLLNHRIERVAIKIQKTSAGTNPAVYFSVHRNGSDHDFKGNASMKIALNGIKITEWKAIPFGNIKFERFPAGAKVLIVCDLEYKASRLMPIFRIDSSSPGGTIQNINVEEELQTIEALATLGAVDTPFDFGEAMTGNGIGDAMVGI